MEKTDRLLDAACLAEVNARVRAMIARRGLRPSPDMELGDAVHEAVLHWLAGTAAPGCSRETLIKFVSQEAYRLLHNRSRRVHQSRRRACALDGVADIGPGSLAECWEAVRHSLGEDRDNKQFVALLLAYCGGFSQTAIGLICGESTTCVSQRLSRARRKIRRTLNCSFQPLEECGPDSAFARLGRSAADE